MMMMIIFREYAVTFDDNDYIRRVYSHNLWWWWFYLESIQSQLMIMIILREYSVIIDDDDDYI